MTSKRFLSVALGGGILAALLLVAASVAADPFFLFHRAPAAGADVSFYDNERLFKYWLSRRFVPGAYRTVILGPSYTASLDPERVRGGAEVYNLSFRGANSAEMRILAETLVAAPAPAGKVRWAFVCVDPYLFKSVNPRSDDLSPKNLRMAYGSWPLVSLYFQRLLGRPLNPLAKFFNRHGANNEYAYLEGKDSTPYIEAELAEKHDAFAAPFVAKDAAVENFRLLLLAFREAGVRVLLFQPPKPAAHRALKGREYAAFYASLLPKVGAPEGFLDFVDDPRGALPDSYFLDAGGHLSERGSAWLLENLLQEATLREK